MGWGRGLVFSRRFIYFGNFRFLVTFFYFLLDYRVLKVGFTRVGLYLFRFLVFSGGSLFGRVGFGYTYRLVYIVLSVI